MFSGCIIGHSFVLGLSDALASRHGLGNGAGGLLGPHRPLADLHIDHHFDNVVLWGVSGLKILGLTDFLVRLATFQPDILVIDVGSNDITELDPYPAAHLLVDTIINHIFPIWTPKRTTICSQTFRSSHTGQLPPPLFNDRIHELNGVLRDLCFNTPGLHYHSHPGFWTNPISSWSNDGIHPNSTFGRKRYKASLRTALMHGASYLHSLPSSVSN